MDPDRTHRLVATLADVDHRMSGVAALATHLGARAVFVFTPDVAANGKLIPAVGCPSTMPASRGWRELLTRAAIPGIYAGPVAYPTATETSPAVAYAYADITYVAIGDGEPDREIAALLGVTAPLLAATMRAESAALFARSDLEVARQSAERAATLARALDRSRQEAERAMRVKDEFLAMLGHELRNPLAPIVTALQMLRIEGVSSRAQDVLERQVSHVQRLVDDLLDVSRITRGKIDLRRERIEVSAIVQRALEMCRPLLEQKRSELVLEVPERGLVIDGDPARLAQVVSNLVNNAAKYSDPGTRIRVAAERAGATARIRVEDQGIGIDPAYLDRVFDNFVQIPQGIDRASGGLGLGLAIVRNLVSLHGGNVRAFSTGHHQGCTFVVELPAIDAVDAPIATVVAVEPVQATTSARVLVVDDNCDAAELLGEVLAAHGHDVQIAHSGPDALRVVETFTPDAALLDIGLPVMDGYELAGHLHARLPKIRLIALTGYGQPNDRERTKAAGFDAHLTKPVTIANVTQTLEELLQQP